jgi:sugar phosphate isomerase/epimerase
VPSLCKAGDASRADALDDCRRAIEQAQEIGAPCVVFTCGGIGDAPSVADARARVVALLHETAPIAEAAGVRIGLEPFHPMHAAERGCVNTMAQARALRDAVGPTVALVLDVFHCWWDPDIDAAMEPARLDALATVHLCDWRVPTRHPVMDRAMPGDGAGDVHRFVRTLETNGYRGPYEIEVFSEEWGARDPAEVARIAAERFDALFVR